MLHCFVKKAAFACLLFSALGAFAQPGKERLRKLSDRAEERYEYGDFLTARRLYDSLLLAQPANDEYNYKAGVCSYQMGGSRERTLAYFEKVSPSYNNNELHYYLGSLYHQNSSFEAALTQFEAYLNNLGPEPEHSKQDVLFQIKKIFYAKSMEASPLTNVRIDNMGGTINTAYPEYAPLIPADESFLVFTARNDRSTGGTDPYGQYFEDVFITKPENGQWQAPSSISPLINTGTHEACTGITPDGQKLLIYRTDKAQTGGDIYYSLSNGQAWTEPKMLEEDINTKQYLESSACYAPDGETIFFTAVRPEGYGGKDIYMIRKLPNGRWGAPFNVGPSVNTPYDEEAPFVHPNGHTLFFCSKGHDNMGAFDVFKSDFNETSVFSEAVNMGYPINTPNNDFCFVLNTTGATAYMASDRPGGFGATDLYKVTFYQAYYNLDVVNSFILDESNARLKKAEITLFNSSTMKVEGMYKPNELTGKFVMVVEPGKKYLLVIKSPGYKTYMEPFICDGAPETEFHLKTEQ